MSASGYHEGTWRGFPNYVCDSCPFASLTEVETSAHVEHKHRPKPRPALTGEATPERKPRTSRLRRSVSIS